MSLIADNFNRKISKQYTDKILKILGRDYMSDEKKIQVGDGIKADNASWSFSGETAKSFSDHVKKSVPLYEEGHDLILKYSDYFIDDQSVVYEIGSSTGTLTRKLAQRNRHRKAKIIGIDSQESMVAQALKENKENLINMDFVTANAFEYEYLPSDLIISYYVVQFIPTRSRQELINKIYDTLNWGGAFIWFEKVRAPDARFQDYINGLYTEYKLDNGYNAEEIVSKSRSLKRVLEPFSTEGNFGLMKRAGFVDVMPIMKYLCFEGYIAIK